MRRWGVLSSGLFVLVDQRPRVALDGWTLKVHIYYDHFRSTFQRAQSDAVWICSPVSVILLVSPGGISNFKSRWGSKILYVALRIADLSACMVTLQISCTDTADVQLRWYPCAYHIISVVERTHVKWTSIDRADSFLYRSSLVLHSGMLYYQVLYLVVF